MNADDVRRVDAVQVPATVALELAGLIDTLEHVVAQRRDGARLHPRVHQLRDQLRAAADTTTDDHVRTQVAQHDWLHTSHHEAIDSRTAARILGCTPANVRDLARRHRLPGHRNAGRWHFDHATVQHYAQHREAQQS